MKTFILLFSMGLLFHSCSDVQIANHDLEDIFTDPPEAAQPWVYWYWMDGNASREGIIKDLNEMAEVGIGGAYLMPVGTVKNPLVDPPAYPLTDHWWSLINYAIEEADRLGLRIAMNACDGWAVAGGPWIEPEFSMQKVVWENTIIEGHDYFSGKLNKPVGYKKYEDYCPKIAVLAFPAPAGWGVTSSDLTPVASTNMEGVDAQQLVSSGEIQELNEGWIQYEFEQPFTCRSIDLSPSPARAFQLHRMDIQISDDGKNFHSIGQLEPPWHGWQDGSFSSTYSVDNVTSRFFRFVFDTTGTPAPTGNMRGTVGSQGKTSFIADVIQLNSSASINVWRGKAGYNWRRAPWTQQSHVPEGTAISTGDIIDLTDMVDENGVLNWTPPSPGKWIVQYFGYTTTGHENAPAGRGPDSIPTGRGLEADKFNAVAAQIQYNGWFGATMEYIQPSLRGKTLMMNHTDSWEAGSQNWSPVFRDEFIKRRGYDPINFLPCMTGIPVQSANTSEQFLYDIRRTITDLISDAFYKTTVQLTHDAGALFSAECTAPTMMSDGLQIYGDVDFPMGEFWIKTRRNLSKPGDIEDAVSGGHIYGKHIIQAEAFTLKGMDWSEDPFQLKAPGDFAFARGINRFVLHVWAHQAFPEKSPGVTLNNVGTFFGGNQTWHQPGKVWFDYLKRCQAVLQYGLPVADVCYFTGEEQPSRAILRDQLDPGLPEGYDYDCINRDALLTRAEAKNGKLVLPDGVSYNLLVLPNSENMTSEVAEKIGLLAKAGVAIIGPMPSKSYSLSDSLDGNKHLNTILSESWGNIRNDIKPDEMLRTLNIPEDIEFIGIDMKPVNRGEMEYKSPSFAWNHRKSKNSDLYFLSNQEQMSRSVDVKFRVTGRQPELWHPETGRIRIITDYTTNNDYTIIPLEFEPSESYFIVFQKKLNVAIDQKENSEPNFPHYEQMGKIDGPWEVSLQSYRTGTENFRLDNLISLSEHDNFGVKHFSGTASYETTFEWDALPTEPVYLDLGNVKSLAEVILNNKNLGVVWTSPFRVDITDAIIKGSNNIKIEVTNTWKNRLIGDGKVKEQERISQTYYNYNTVVAGMNKSLDQAGLMGPVTIQQVNWSNGDH